MPPDTICIGGITQIPDPLNPHVGRCINKSIMAKGSTSFYCCPACPSEIGLYRLLCQYDVLSKMMIAVGIHVDDQAFVGQAGFHSQYISVA